MEALDTQPLYSSDLGPEPCSCDEALALRAELDAKHATLVRVADEARALRTELARTRFLSVVRGRLCDAWAKMLDRTRTELDETQVAYYGCSLHRDELEAKLAGAKAAVEAAEKRANEEALTHDNLLEEVESYRELFLGAAALADNTGTIGALREQVAEAKRAAETWEELAHGQEELGKQADALVERFKALALDASEQLDLMRIARDAAYTERNRLVALVARICKPTAGIRRTPIEGWNPEWTNCVFIDTSQGQMSWHYHDSDAHLFADLPAYEKPWDGHTTAEKYERLWRLTELTAALP